MSRHQNTCDRWRIFNKFFVLISRTGIRNFTFSVFPIFSNFIRALPAQTGKCSWLTMSYMALWASEQNGGWVGDWMLQLHSCYDYYPDAKIGFKHFSSLPNYFQWRRTFFYSSGCSNCKGCNTNKILINFKVRQSPWIKRWVHETMVSPKVETKLLIAITIRINIFLISPSIKKQSWGRQLHHWRNKTINSYYNKN